MTDGQSELNEQIAEDTRAYGKRDNLTLAMYLLRHALSHLDEHAKGVGDDGKQTVRRLAIRVRVEARRIENIIDVVGEIRKALATMACTTEGEADSLESTDASPAARTEDDVRLGELPE